MNINELLNNIPDPKLRKQVQDMHTGKIVSSVKCMSKSCKGRLIGYIYDNNTVQPVAEKGKMYMRSWRHRFDGNYGFECWCGNDSRVADSERGTGVEHDVTFDPKKDLPVIAERLTKKPAKYIIENGKQNVDNFLIETL